VLGGIWFVLLPALLFGTMSVLGPLRLHALGFGAVAIGATWLLSAALEAVVNPLLGRLSDRHGRLLPLRGAVLASGVLTCVLPWPRSDVLLAALIVLAALSFGSFWTPALSLLADEAEHQGLEYGYAFALINLAWAPGQALGSSVGGALADATTDAVPYLALAALCLGTLAVLVRRAGVARPLPRTP
jgi:MFS family permease